MNKSEFYAFLKRVPKAEIHLHAEGTMSRRGVQALIDRKPAAVKDKIDPDKIFQYNNLSEFIASFLKVQSLIESPDDFQWMMNDLALYLKDSGVVYSEVFFSPSMFLKKGFDFEEMMLALQKAIDEIRLRDGIVIRLILDVSRTFGLDNAERNLDLILKHRIPAILGIGLGGDEQKGPAKEYGPVFVRAANAGLYCVAHAGEDVGPESIWDALEILGAQRIGHGISAIQDTKLMSLLREKQIPLEICLTSNLFTKKYVSRAKDHPVRAFFDFGMRVTINTDDPTFFHCTLIDEFWTLHNDLGFNLDELKQLVVYGFEATQLPTLEKLQWIEKVNAVWKDLS